MQSPHSRAYLFASAIIGAFLIPQISFALGEAPYVASTADPGSFAIVQQGQAAPLYVESGDWPGVIRAANDLKADITRVTSVAPNIVHDETKLAPAAIIVGTIGKSSLVDRLIRDHKVNVDGVTGQWESFVTQVVTNPLPGLINALVIAGSDKRGTIYGIYDLSEQIGVSPWYWWADVPVRHKDALFVKAGRYTQGPPSVKYRGIFLNDEAPDLSNWVREKYGSVPGMPNVANYGRGFYTNLFELMLRVRANYLWPAMWNNAFNEDDTENPRLADEYGIVMGTSHQEPMLRAQKEWDRSYGRTYRNWNYNNTNQQPVLQQFWRDGIQRNKNFESIVTLGLRAENDSGAELGKDLTEQVIGVQRKILAEEINPDLTKVPQLWCLYKEVQGYYNEGLRVPDDVTLLWAEDNWGDVRRLPTAEERKRSGGAGVYYHFDYHGGPRSYQWLNTSPIPKIWDQLSLAKEYGADRIWIVNVGHFKGYEFPLEYLMHLGWNSAKWTNTNLNEYTRLWAEREFGPTYSADIADLVSKYSKYNGRRKPELLDANTYSLVNYGEFETVVADYEALAARAGKINDQLPLESRDAFYELVLFPIKACAELNAMYLSAAKNHLYARQGRASANDYADETRRLFAVETNLIEYFNRDFAGGKWSHFMDQPYIGYVSWNEPRRNNLDPTRLVEIALPDAAAMGVAVEGSENAVTNGETSLPQFDSFNRQKFYIDVFNKGKTPFEGVVSPMEPWIQLDETRNAPALKPLLIESNPWVETNGTRHHPVIGARGEEYRILASVNWDKAPKGLANGTIKVSGAAGEVTVKVTAFNPTEVTRDSLNGFVEGEGVVSIEPEHFTKNSDAGPNRWIKIEDYGRTLSGMRAAGPANAPAATPGKDSPCLEYQMYLFSTGAVEVTAITSPTLNFMPDRGLRFAVSFDNETPAIVTLVPQNYNAQNGNRDWETSVRDNARYARTRSTISKPGYHTLKFWMVDPAIVLQKIVVDLGGLKHSYLGPPESFRVP